MSDKMVGRAIRKNAALASLCACAGLLFFAGRATAQENPSESNTWKIDAPESQVQFSTRHIGIVTVTGGFTKFNGTVSYDPNDPSHTTMQVTIDTTSEYSGIDLRDKDLKSANFLDVEKYPTMTFQSKRAEVAGPGKLKITGDLTLHGVTKEVVLDVTGPTPVVKDRGTHIGAEATAKIDRKDFGMTFNRVLDNGGIAIGNEIAIDLQIELTQAAAPPAH